MLQITIQDITVSDDILNLFGASRKEVMDESREKFNEFIDGTNKHLAILKTASDMNLFIVNAKTNVKTIVSENENIINAFKLEQCLDKLDDIPEWNEFLKSYTEDRANALTNVLTAHRPITSEVRRVTEASLSAIGYFREYIYSVNATAADGATAILNDISIGLYNRAIEIVEAELSRELLKTKGA